MSMDTLLTTAQAAERAGCRESFLRKVLAVGRGPVPAVHHGPGRGRGFRFEAAEVDRWAAARRRRKRCDATVTTTSDA